MVKLSARAACTRSGREGSATGLCPVERRGLGQSPIKMKLLIISGTPKTDGVTYSFVKVAEETAKELNINAETIRLSSMDITKCKMCGDGWGICFQEHRCIFGDADGFNALQKKVMEADAYIYITPVYWGEISEEMKIFVDKLRRCQATKQWDSREDEVSFHKSKPSIVAVVAGGGGGGVISAFGDMERAITQMSGDGWPREEAGIFDWISVNRWNQDYKREAFKSAITKMVNYHICPKFTTVKPLPDYKIHMEFDNGETRIFDMKPYLDISQYVVLKDVERFNKMKITGFYIDWGSRVDIGIEILYKESKAI